MRQNGRGRKHTPYDLIIGSGNINFAPESEAEEIMQNVETICTTVKGTVPLARDFGIPAGLADEPENILRAKLGAQIIAAVRKHEPRADIQGVSFRESEAGKIVPAVRIGRSG